MSPTVDTVRVTKSIDTHHRFLIGESQYPPPPDLTSPHLNSEMLARAPHEQLTTHGPSSKLHSRHRKKTNRRNNNLSNIPRVYSGDGDSSDNNNHSNDNNNDTQSGSHEYTEADFVNDSDNDGSGGRAINSEFETYHQSTSFDNEKRVVNSSRQPEDLRDEKWQYPANVTNYSQSTDRQGDGLTRAASLTPVRNGEWRGGVRNSTSLSSSSYKTTGLSNDNGNTPSSLPYRNEEHAAIHYNFKTRGSINDQHDLKGHVTVSDNVLTAVGMTSVLKSSPAVDVGGGANPGGLVSSKGSEGSPQRVKSADDPSHVSHQFFHLEPCLYTHRMFERASRIFSVLKHDDADTEEKKALRRRNGDVQTVKGKIPEMDFIDAQEQIKTFELTFATLKFQKLFSYILDFIGFFYKYTNLNDHYSLVYVIFHDLQTRKFQRRIPFPDEDLDPACTQVEEALLAEKIKLQANIAKERIKHNAPSVDFLLPEHVRNKDETKAKTPVYMWVNQMKSTIENVVSNLKADNFRLMDAGTDMSDVTDHAFLIDPHCADLLTFPPHLNIELKALDMVKSGLLVQQDKSSCLAPQTVTYLLGHDTDVIHVNIGTAMTTCHLASLLRHRSPHSHIWAFGVDGPQKTAKVIKTMESLEVKNVKIVHDDFLNIDPEDSRFKSVRVILISANCSKSAITSPVQFIVSEGEDTQILGELSMGEANMSHVRDLMVDHERLLKHALQFPKAQAVVYTTRSRFEAENEQVVTKVLDFLLMTTGKRNPFKVAPPVLPFSGDEINTGKGGVDGRYVRFPPSDKANGCFVAIIAREPEESKEPGKLLGGKKSKASVSKASSAHTTGGRKSRKSVKAGISLPEVPGAIENGDGTETPLGRASSSNSAGGVSLKQKISQHKSPAAAGARLYQKRLIDKMEKSREASSSQPEHLRVIKHPSPFR